MKTAKKDSNKFYLFVALAGLNNEPDFFLFHADIIYEIMRKKIKLVEPDKVHGPWDIKLSDIFGIKENEIIYRNNNCWNLLRKYLQ